MAILMNVEEMENAFVKGGKKHKARGQAVIHCESHHKVAVFTYNVYQVDKN